MSLYSETNDDENPFNKYQENNVIIKYCKWKRIIENNSNNAYHITPEGLRAVWIQA